MNILNQKKWPTKFKYFRSYWLRKTCSLKCIKAPVSQNPLAVNVLTSPKTFWNLQKRTFINLFIIVSSKKLFFVRYEILGLLVNTLTTNCEYSRSNRENLQIPFRIELSEKQKHICGIFIVFLISKLNFEQFGKRRASKFKYFWSYWLLKMPFLKCIKSLVCENPLAEYMLGSPKNLWNLKKALLSYFSITFS